MVREATAKISSSMPFRLGLLFTLIYLVCFTIGAFVFYTSMKNKVLKQTDQVLGSRYQNMQRIYQRKGLEEVIRVVKITESSNPMQFGMGFQIVEPSGEVLLGNIDGFERKTGFYNVSGDDLGFDPAQTYRFYTNKLGENDLTLGVHESLLDDLRKNSISSFSVTFIFTTLLALMGSMFLAIRSHARVRNLARFMENVGQGDLASRLPISYRGDDIDRLSGNMNNALSLLQQQVDGMKQVSANIAHDLKTPLNRLYIKIEEACGMVKPDDPVLTKLCAASDEAAQINGTFEALLRIAQLEAGARKANFVQTDLVAILQKAYEVYEVVVEESQQLIEIESSQDKLPLLGDDDLLLQLVVNLVENAIRHCPPNAKIQISSGLADNKPWISVCDTGPGIPEEARERVFERLFRLEASRTTSGSGLGLSLVKAIVEVHDGEITLSDNEPGLCVKVVFYSK